MRDTQPMGLKYHAFCCCYTLFGSYPMSVVFILSYWKLPWGCVFCAKVQLAEQLCTTLYRHWSPYRFYQIVLDKLGFQGLPYRVATVGEHCQVSSLG